MAINLLSYLPKSPLSPTVGGTQTTTPMGVQAKTPNASVPKPPTTLPAAQSQPVAAPISAAPVSPYSAYTAPSATSTQPATQPAPTTATQPQTATPSFGGYLGQLVSQNQSAPSQAVGTAASTLQGTANVNPGTSGTAYENYLVDQDQYKKDLMAYNNTENGLRTQQGIPLEFQTGRAGAYQLMNSGRLTAEQAGVQNDLAGVGQNISGVQTQQAGANQAGGLANTANAQQIGALGAAVSAAQPQLGSIGQVPFSPIDQGQGTVLGSTQPGGLAAAGTLLGQFQGAQAAGAAPGQGQAAVIGAPYQATASNINTAGTAQTQAASSAYGPLYGQVLDANNQLNNVTSLGSLLLQTGNGGQVNPFNAQFANQTLNQFRSQLSNADQLKFNQTLATFQGAASQLLSNSSNVTPTQVSSWSTGITNGSIPMSALAQMFAQAQIEGKLKVSNLQSETGAAYQGTQGGATGAQPTGNSVQAGGYTFVKDASGNWVAK